MKKLVLALLVLLAAASAFAAGQAQTAAPAAGQAAVDASVPGWKAAAAKPITFDWYINFAWFARSWGNDKTSQYITKKTGVNIRYIVPAGNEAEKLNSMIAGDALPDLITLGWWEGQVPMMIDAGLVLPLDELAKQYDPYFFKVASPAKLGWYQKADGHTYGYPNASYTPQDYATYKGQLYSNETFLVRKDIYEAIGKPDMSTPDGFLAGLRAAKAKFGAVNGQPLIPLGMSEFGEVGCATLEGYLQDFLAVPYEKDGKFYDRNLDPDYLRWLKVFRQAHSEGLIATDVFTDKRSQMEEKVTQGRYFAMLFQNWDLQSAQQNRYAADPNSVYIAVDGPKNAKKSAPTLGGDGISGWTITLISKKCKDPARAIQFLSYLLSEEGQMDITFGEKGVTWDMANGAPALLPEPANLKATDNNAFETVWGAQNTHWMLMDTAMQKKWGTVFPPALRQPQEWTKPYVQSFAAYTNVPLVPGSDEAMIADEVARKWGQTLPALIRAKTEVEFDGLWTAWVQFKKDKGYQKVLDFQTTLMAANKKKLGL
jgi:putative aldouronate transport system substrate-binding protein